MIQQVKPLSKKQQEHQSSQAKAKILIVEDEEDIRILLQYNFDQKGYDVCYAKTGSEGIDKIHSEKPDIVILDWMLPGQSGIEICKNIRTLSSYPLKETPILMLSAKSEEENKVEALKAGADDYVTKPFSFQELFARIEALLRRSNAFQDKKAHYTYHDLHVDLTQKQAFLNNDALKLTPIEFKILALFVQYPDKIFTRDALIDNVWPDNQAIEPRTIDVNIKRLRQLIDPLKVYGYIKTIRGEGYLFIGKTHQAI